MGEHTQSGHGDAEDADGDAVAEFEWPGAGMSRDPRDYPPSPVPSDQRLWPGELPFTAFGQHGVDGFDLRVFDQTVYWVDRLGDPHLLAEMSLEYVENVIGFLIECRETYFADTQRRWFVQTLGDQVLYDDPGADVLAVAAGGPTWSDLDAETWLESTPLMRALRSRVAQRG